MRLDRPTNQRHACLSRCAIAFAHVAFYAGQHEVFPGVIAPSGSRDDMVDGELGFRELARTVLTRVLVALEYVPSRETHFFVEKPVEAVEQDDLGNADLERGRVEEAAFGPELGQLTPVLEVV